MLLPLLLNNLLTAAAPTNPVFIGPAIGNLVLTKDVLMAPRTYSDRFTDDGALTYAITGTALPTGLSLSSAGVLTGTPTVVATTTGHIIRATDPDTNTVDSNAFSITVSTFTLPGWVDNTKFPSWIMKISKVLVVTTTNRTKWIHYIPVKQVVPSSDSVNRYDQQGAVAVQILSSGTGLREWVDYIPVVEVADADSGRWRTDNTGFIPIVGIP